MKEFKILGKFLKIAIDTSKIYVVALVYMSVLKAAMPFIAVFVPRLILNELTGNMDVGKIFSYVVAAILIAFVLDSQIVFLNRLVKLKQIDVQNAIFAKPSEVMMECEYANLEDSKFIDLKERAMYSATSTNVVYSLINAIPVSLAGLFSTIGAIGIILSFDYIIILIIMTLIIINHFLQKHFQAKEVQYKKRSAAYNKYYAYYLSVLRDSNVNKESRFHRMENFIVNKFKNANEQIEDIMESNYNKIYPAQALTSAISAFQIG